MEDRNAILSQSINGFNFKHFLPSLVGLSAKGFAQHIQGIRLGLGLNSDQLGLIDLSLNYLGEDDIAEHNPARKYDA